jgi:hypothetical protein
MPSEAAVIETPAGLAGSAGLAAEPQPPQELQEPQGHKVNEETARETLALVLARQSAAQKERQTHEDNWRIWRKLYVAEVVIPDERRDLNNIFDPVLWDIAQTQAAKLLESWFGEKPLFPVAPHGDEDREAAANIEKYLQWQIDANMLRAETNPWIAIDRTLVQFLHYGSMPMSVSWDAKTARPVLECGDIWEYLWDPLALRGYRARYFIRRRVVDRDWVDEQVAAGFYDKEAVARLFNEGAALGDLAQTEDGENPERLVENLPDDKVLDRMAGSGRGSELRGAIKTAAQKRYRHDAPIKLLEYWEPDRQVHVLNGCCVAHDGPSPYEIKELPAWLIPVCPMPDQHYGIGNAQLGHRTQVEINIKGNQALDNVDLLLNPPIKVRKGSTTFNLKEAKFEPGHAWEMDDLGDVEPMHLPNYLIGTYQDRQNLIHTLKQRLGVSEYSQGMPGADRVASTVRLLIEQTNKRIGLLAQRFFEYGVKPWYRWSLALNLQFGTPEDWQRVRREAPDPFQAVRDAGGSVEDLVRDLVVPASYYAGSKALRAQTFSEIVIKFGQMPQFAQFLNPPEILGEIFRLAEVPAPERFLTQGQMNEEELVNRENETLMLGGSIVPHFGENHELHIVGHMNVAAELDQVLAGMDPVLVEAIQQAFTVHLAATRHLRDMEQGAARGEQRGPAPASPAAAPGGLEQSPEVEAHMSTAEAAAGIPEGAQEPTQ